MKPQSSQTLRRQKEPILPYSYGLTVYTLIGTLFFYAIIQTLADLTSRLPKSEAFRQFYQRGISFNTTYIYLGSMAFYIGLLILGFVYVVTVSLGFERSNILKGSDGTYSDIKHLIIYGIIYYFLSGIVALRSPYQLQSFCDQSQQKPEHHLMMNNINQDVLQNPMHKMFASVHEMDYHLYETSTQKQIESKKILSEPYDGEQEEDQNELCKLYDLNDVVDYNYHVYTFGFIAGLQITHLQLSFLRDFKISPASMRSWPIYLWIIFSIGVLFFGQIFFYLFHLYEQIGLLDYYTRWAIFIIGVTIVCNKIYSKQGRVLHLHHYILAQIMLVFCCYQNLFVSFIHAFASGVMTEGLARWGAGEIWQLKQVNQTQPELKSNHEQYMIINQDEDRKCQELA
ncbi:UNKNOWN [Stylonychia lemnae]|uniref:Uncharacterized protein n=1 Tax=Stylonychia lemnae TaxID=5949 RepID=A0A078ASU8_STYLE|nr:UNKNOWN [Stylonychia lemnae]|eukprot:CDW85264.1 UNKNOWN [Stylonychia lemnae]